MREYYSATSLNGMPGPTRMKCLLTLTAGALLALPALAESPADDCAKARDPARCEARQAALKTCSGMRRAEKEACLEANIPHVDCRQAKEPEKCAAARQARETCKNTNGSELKKCMRDEQQRKKPKARQSPPAS